MRYAIFFSPPKQHALTLTAAKWLGRDTFSGQTVAQSEFPLLSADDLQTFTKAPQRYGFHATLKAPFYLAGEQSEANLLLAVQAFAKEHRPFTMPRLKVSQLGAFFALVPEDDVQELNQFVNGIVETFEPFRAPLTDADYQRRNPEKLSERQRTYLRDWGYPYIFDEFRFHMTLTGPVAAERAPDVLATLQGIFDPLLSDPLTCDGITLFTEKEAGGPFRVHPISMNHSLPDEKVV